MAEFLASFGPSVIKGVLIGVALTAVYALYLLYPRRRESTAKASMTLPYSREAIWNAYFANARLLTPGLTFGTLSKGTEIAYTDTVGETDSDVVTMTVTVMDNDLYRRFAAHVHTCNGEPFIGGTSACDGLVLEDADGGQGTIATVFLHLETPNRLHEHFLRKSVVLTLQKMCRRLETGQASPDGALAPA